MSLTQRDRDERWAEWLAWEASSGAAPMPSKKPVMHKEKRTSMSAADGTLYDKWIVDWDQRVRVIPARPATPAVVGPPRERRAATTQIEWDPDDVMSVQPNLKRQPQLRTGHAQLIRCHISMRR